MRAKDVHAIAMESGTLFSVPAVHFQADFALAVNRACGDPAFRPDAIAVEIGPAVAAEACRWLGELGVGPARRTRLPCMLGLVKRNRHLRPSVRERALELQRETGKDLLMLPPALLREELRFSASSVLPLSPVDSIVEAMRCACELGVPLYGVDLDEMADPVYPDCILPDPAGSGSVPSEALLRLAGSAPGDPEIDPRRETAMAARLKGLLQRHGRVLFTGGMGHWDPILKLLSDPALAPSVKGLDPPGPIEPGSIRRTVVHPAVAVAYMDAFPAIAGAFERMRRHPGLDPPGRRRRIRRNSILRTLLRKTYRRRFSASGGDKRPNAMSEDWSGRIAFEQLLCGQTLLSMRSRPTLFLIDACARATLSADFRGILRRTLMEHPWADPADHPGCGHLRPALFGEGTPGQFVFRDGSGEGGIEFPALMPGGHNGPASLYAPEDRDDPRDAARMEVHYRFTWRPWEDLMNALCAMAATGNFRHEREPRPEPYSGEMLEGLDVKATLRSHCRGQERIWVRDGRPRPVPAVPRLPQGFPVVWIFDEAATADGGVPNWSTYFEPVEWLAGATEDPVAFLRRLRAPGDALLDIVTCARPGQRDRFRLDQAGIGCETLSGLVIFSPIFPTYRQTVRWYLATEVSNNPVAWRNKVENGIALARRLAARVVHDFGQLRWQDLLIAMAVPFGGPTLTVVAPPGFVASPEVVQGAVRYGKRIRIVPTTRFSAELLRRIVRYHVVPGRLDENGATEYIPEAERIIGEPTDAYRHLVPPSWLTFGLEE